MKHKILINYQKKNRSDLNSIENDLIESAVCNISNAYAPYSGFEVGSAVLLENRRIVAANNQENVSFPSGLCAERVAIFYAVSRFPDTSIISLAVSARSKKFNINNIISPCGSCRQVIAEYQIKQERKIKIFLHQSDDTVLIFDSIEDLLPLMFQSPNLKIY